MAWFGQWRIQRRAVGTPPPFYWLDVSYNQMISLHKNALFLHIFWKGAQFFLQTPLPFRFLFQNYGFATYSLGHSFYFWNKSRFCIKFLLAVDAHFTKQNIFNKHLINIKAADLVKHQKPCFSYRLEYSFKTFL